MLGWALTFLIVALIAAVLGFGGIAGFAVEIAKIIFFVAIILLRHLWPDARPFAHRPVSRIRCRVNMAPPGHPAGPGFFLLQRAF